jgi:hypothetical protein
MEGWRGAALAVSTILTQHTPPGQYLELSRADRRDPLANESL